MPRRRSGRSAERSLFAEEASSGPFCEVWGAGHFIPVPATDSADFISAGKANLPHLHVSRTLPPPPNPPTPAPSPRCVAVSLVAVLMTPSAGWAQSRSPIAACSLARCSPAGRSRPMWLQMQCAGCKFAGCSLARSSLACWAQSRPCSSRRRPVGQTQSRRRRGTTN